MSDRIDGEPVPRVSAPGVPFPRPRPVAALVVAQCLFAAAAAAMIILHVGSPIDPVTAMLSEYAWSPGWWLWDGALVLTSAGSALLVAGLRRHGLLTGAFAWACLLAWIGSLLAVALFTKDPQGGATTPTGKAHLYATALSCVTLPLASWALGRTHRSDPRWQRHAAWSRRLAWAAVPFFLPFLIPFAVDVLFGRHLPTVATGLVERLMAGLELVLLVHLARWGRHSATVPVPQET